MNSAVVILNWNGRDFLQKFLPPLLRHTPADVEIVVGDNGSTDDSLTLLQNNFPTVRIVALDQNYGFAGGYNRVLEQLDHEYWILLNSDVEVTPNWVEPLIEALKDPAVAAVQPKIVAHADPTRFEYAGASGGFVDALGYPFCRGRLVNECEADEGQYDDRREVFWASGAAFGVRADAFRRAGGFDDRFFAHMEEIDLCWRFKRLGYRIEVEPQSAVRHVGAGTLPVWSPRKTYLNFRNNIAMLYKNLTAGRFAAVYAVRLGTDALRAVSYLVSGKLNFAAAIFRGHRDFWRTRRRYPRLDAPKGRVGQIYRGSVVLHALLVKGVFGNMMR